MILNLCPRTSSCSHGAQNTGGYEDKEKGQTVVSDDLSALAPLTDELLNLWNDFRKVVEFIEDNRVWLLPLIKSSH
jgi:hypothetical protein